eukprot:3996614-Pyramimonas_sp.AAC.1
MGRLREDASNECAGSGHAWRARRAWRIAANAWGCAGGPRGDVARMSRARAPDRDAPGAPSTPGALG